MSSILKALKRLEQEKATRRDGEIDLSREILHEAAPRRQRFSWPWAAAISTITLLFALVAVLLTRGTPPVRTEHTPAKPGEARLPAPPPPVATDMPAGKTAPVAAAVPRVETAPVPKAARAPLASPAPARTTIPLPPPEQPATQAPSLPATAPPVTAPPPRAEPVRKPAPPAPAEPAFSVSGIAWNKDSADRLAIVNGQPLTTGSFLEGAVVEEILPDRVRFSQGGRTFEVHLGKSGKTH